MISPEPGDKAQRKVDYTNYYAKTMRRNYYRKLSVKIITKNYDLVYQSRRKVEIYRDTGVSKNALMIGIHLDFLNNRKITMTIA